MVEVVVMVVVMVAVVAVVVVVGKSLSPKLLPVWSWLVW